MDGFFTPSLLWGPLRILIFLVFIYTVNIVIIRKASIRKGLDYFMLRFPLFISLLIMVSLILTQVNGYDFFVILTLFMLIAIIRFLNLNTKKPIKKQLIKIQKRSIIYIVRTFEQGDRLLSKKNFKKQQKGSKINLKKKNAGIYMSKSEIYWQITLIMLLSLLAFGSRYYFFHYDTYLLSDIWYNDLANLKDITKQHWFFHQATMMGLFSVINFYNEITGITDAVALTSFGFIESILVSISIFWSVNKFTGSKITPGLIAALSYIFLYALLPINIDLITQPKSVLFSFTIILPLIVYAFKPKSLFLNSKKHFIVVFMFLFSIMHIDLFLIINIIPFIILIAIVFNYKKYKKLMINLFSAYCLVLAISFLMLLIASKVQGINLMTFINSNLYSYRNYTYSPQLILPIKRLLDIYLITTLIIILFSTYLWRVKKKKKNKLVLMVSLLIACFFSLPKLNIPFIDIDLLNQVLSICIPILIGLSSYILYSLFNLSIKKIKLSNPIKIAVTFIIIISISFTLDNSSLIKDSKKTAINGEIIKVYDKMNSDLLPFSYGVVNNYMNARLGENRHFFLNYSYFTEEYLIKDEIFYAHKDDYAYFKKNPEDILPQSILVFIYNDQAVLNGDNGLILEEQKSALANINLLKTKGREIQIYYKTKMLTVYEIINKPKSSKIIDLLL